MSFNISLSVVCTLHYLDCTTPYIYNILFTGIGDRHYVGKFANMMIPRSYHKLQQKILGDIDTLKSLNDKNEPTVLWNKIKRYLDS